MATEFPERVERRIRRAPNGLCWEWIGAKDRDGYGKIPWRLPSGRGSGYAHRVVYELAVAPIPTGLTIDHLCRNRGCVNPAHLEPVTHRVNTLRGQTFSGKNARKTHCIRGHAFDETNTHRSSKGERVCRACSRIRTAAYKARRRELAERKAP
jgi:hypothetical protein